MARFNIPSRAIFLRALCRGAVLFVAAACVAAGPTTTPTSKPTTEAASVESTVEALQAQIKRVEVNTDITESDKKELLSLYNQALAQVQAGAESKAKMDEHEKQRQEAPALIAQIKEKLDQPVVKHVPQVPKDATLAQLEQKLDQARADLVSAQKKLREIEDKAPRADLRTEIPRAIAELKQKLDEVADQQKAPSPPDESLELRVARRTLLRAKRTALQRHLDLAETLLLGLDIRKDLQRAQRDLANREVRDAERQVEFWEHLVNRRRVAEAAQAAQEARQKLVDAHPAVRTMAERNAALAQERSEPAKKMDKVDQDLAGIQKTLDTLVTKFEGKLTEKGTRSATGIKAKVEAAGVTSSISMLLRKERANLPDVDAHGRDVAARQAEIATVQSRIIQLEEDRNWYADVDSRVAEVMSELSPSLKPVQRVEVEQAVREQVRTAADYTDALLDDYDRYFEKLVELDTAQRKLIERSKEYGNYIDENIFWFRSTAAFRPADLPVAAGKAAWFVDPAGWYDILRSLTLDVRTHPFLNICALAAFLGLLWHKFRFRRDTVKANPRDPDLEAESFRQTAHLFVQTLLVALVWPVLLLFLAWRLDVSTVATGFTRAVAAGLEITAVVLLTLEVFMSICLPGGIAERHFRWDPRKSRVIRVNLYWLMFVALPAVFIIAALEWGNDEVGKNSLGRLAFVLLLAAFAVFMRNVLSPLRLVLQRSFSGRREGWGFWTHYIWFPVAVGAPLVLAVIAALGYYYTALELAWRMLASLWLLLALMIVHEMLLRWLYLAYRRLAARKLDSPAAASPSRPDGLIPVSLAKAPHPEESEMNIFTINAQTRKLLDSFTLFILILMLWAIWNDVLPALGALRNVNLWTYNLVDLLLALVILFMTYIAGRNVPGLLEIAILPRLPLDGGLRFAITSVTRYAIIVLGVILAFNAIHVDWSKIQWLVAALTVGLSFGLQEIFANFVSGLIILFERPMRVGDIITVGPNTGTVTRIHIRATTITDSENKELIVPNKEFITSRVVNWTLSDRVLRLTVPISVAYGADTDRVQRLLLQVAHANPRILKQPPPAATFAGFGPTTLSFELGVYTTAESISLLRHELNTEIYRTLADAGIKIP